MSNQPPPVATTLPWVEVGDGCLQLTLSSTLYPDTAIFRTCYLFTDKCFIFLRPNGSNELLVEFRAKGNPEDLDRVVGEFGNELVDQRVRCALEGETQRIRELIVTQAFAEADFGGSEI
jgi:His-Xaa-Ser system protein HxsD